MRLAIIDDKTGIVHPVIDNIEQYDLDKPLAKAEVGIAVQLAVTEVKRGEHTKGTVLVVKEVERS